MEPLTKTQALDRHALVITIWLSAGLVAMTLFHYGLGAGGTVYIFAAFATVIAAFAGHVIVNATVGGGFSARELALGLVIYAVALLAFGAAALVSRDFAARAFLPAGGGFVAIGVAFVFYLIVHSGVRTTFDAFDTIRSFSSHDSFRGDNGGEPPP
jgi:hypothetical protein